MKVATAHLTSAAPYSQSRAHQTEKLPRETADLYEQRTWKEKLHTLPPNGEVFIPPMSFKMALDTAAKMLGRQIPGKGKSTYGKFFTSGVLCMQPVTLGLTLDDVQLDRIHANADGVRGSGKRVWRNFPRIDQWEADATFHIVADEITTDLFEEHLRQAGAFVGIGRFRPQNGGYYGRFEIQKIKWS
jgi:hypothetical protein